MRRSLRLAEKQTKPGNESGTNQEPKAKKSRSDNGITTIIAMDNGTMVEVFKHLNYSQLAKNSLVSKRFSNLIRTHRHTLARLDVSFTIEVSYLNDPVFIAPVIEMFNKELSADAYNELINRNHYAKQIPVEGHVTRKKSKQYDCQVYQLCAESLHDDPTDCETYVRRSIFFARAKLNHENWPLFQHFARLLTDPFIYIRWMKLADRNDFLNLLAGSIHPNSDRLFCEELELDSDCSYISSPGNDQKPIRWIKDHVFCEKFLIEDYTTTNCDTLLLDLFTTGARCTSVIDVQSYDPSNVVVQFIQRFMDLKSRDEYQFVELIVAGPVPKGRIVRLLKRNYGKFLVKVEYEADEKDPSTVHVFEFTNYDIGKKLYFEASIYEAGLFDERQTYFSLSIESV